MRKADLVVWLAAQVPLPRKPSVRYHGCFAPNAFWRPFVVLAGLAAVQDKPSLERILRHLRLWRDPEDIVAIRGPPEALWPADLDFYDGFDAVDEVGDMDRAA